MSNLIPLARFLALLRGPAIPPADWPRRWADAMRCFPRRVPFLGDTFLAAAATTCGFSAGLAAELRRAAARVRRDPLLARGAWFLHQLYLGGCVPAVGEVGAWPVNARPLIERAAMIPALVVAAGAPRVAAAHRRRGIPAAVTRATLQDIETWIDHFRRANGYGGLQNMAWLTRHLSGELVRLGRLQFVPARFGGPLRAFVHRRSGRVVALCAPGIRLRRDGYIDGTNDRFDPRAWTSRLELGAAAVTGHPLDPRGFVRRRKRSLPLAAWRPALAPGDPVLDIHIPEGGPMEFDACGASLGEALAFFPRHYPEHPRAAAFVCTSWFLDAQYRRLLPATANIVRFQREFHLYPVRSDDREAFLRVFGTVPADLARAPRDTALRRAMLDFKKRGGALRNAGGFCLTDGWRWGGRRHAR